MSNDITKPEKEDSSAAHHLELHRTEFKFSGPLPDAFTLRQYEEILPGAADRCFKMAEEQAEHRRSEETRENRREHWRNVIGMVASLIVVLAFVALAGYMIKNNQPLYSIITVLLVLVALVWVFCKGKKMTVEASLVDKKILAKLEETEKS